MRWSRVGPVCESARQRGASVTDRGCGGGSHPLKSTHRAWRRDVERAQTDIRLDQTDERKLSRALSGIEDMHRRTRKRFAKTGRNRNQGSGTQKRARAGSFCGAVIRLKGFYVDQNLKISRSGTQIVMLNPIRHALYHARASDTRAERRQTRSARYSTKPPSAAKVSSLSAQAEPALLCGQDSE